MLRPTLLVASVLSVGGVLQVKRNAEPVLEPIAVLAASSNDSIANIAKSSLAQSTCYSEPGVFM